MTYLFPLIIIAALSSAATAEPDVIRMPENNKSAWTEGQVKKFCFSKHEGKPSQFAKCMDRNKTKVGRPKYPGEAAELNKIDKKFTTRANEEAAKSIPKPPIQ